MKIVITGRKGFIGKHLEPLLKSQGHEIAEIGVELNNIHHQVLEVDAVVHLASITVVADFLTNPSEAYDKNVGGVNHILDFCRRNSARLIYISTSGVYDPPSGAVKETDRVAPTNSYSASKHMGELLCARYHRDFGVSVIILRLFNVYGPRQREEFVISYIFNCLYGDGPLNIKAPRALRDFIYVDDVCMAILKVLKRESRELEVFNVGSGKTVSIAELAGKIYRLGGKRMPAEVEMGRGEDIPWLCANLDSVKTHLEWEPKVSLDDGLMMMNMEYTGVQ